MALRLLLSGSLFLVGCQCAEIKCENSSYEISEEGIMRCGKVVPEGVVWAGDSDQTQ